MRRAAPLGAVLLAACASMSGPWTREPSQREWVDSFVEAQRHATAGAPARADSVLERFARQFPTSNEAVETLYWRALFRLDPANAGARPADAVALLDEYLRSSTPTTHLVEAATLRRTALRLDSLQRTVAVSRASSDSAGAGAPGARPTTASADEVTRLKEELTRTQAELDRIKRRLSNPQGRTP